MPKVKKWYNSNRCSYKSILHRVIRWKLLLDGGRNDTFDSWRRRFSGGGFFLQKYFDKICLKAARANMWSVIKGQRDSVFWWGDIQQRGKVQTFRLAGRPTPQIPFPSGTLRSPHKGKPEEVAWSPYCNDFGKSEWEYFLSNQQIYSM